MTQAWELRNRLCESAAKRLPILEKIADDENANPKVRVVAIAMLLQHGLGVPQVQTTDYAGLFGKASKQ